VVNISANSVSIIGDNGIEEETSKVYGTNVVDGYTEVISGILVVL
jgi:hypothetical protein